ncbi:MAG: addiction module protein [Deltaproteobacteria bacterium]|nr:addiction module protein [Deltaproteobacteria bacterium]
MAESAQQIFSKALRLSPVEKAELIERLFLSFDAGKQEEIDSVWAKEVESRIDAYDAGKLQAKPSEAVFVRVNGK